MIRTVKTTRAKRTPTATEPLIHAIQTAMVTGMAFPANVMQTRPRPRLRRLTQRTLMVMACEMMTTTVDECDVDNTGGADCDTNRMTARTGQRWPDRSLRS